MVGRYPPFLAPAQVKAGTYKLHFDTGTYWQQQGYASFYPYVEVNLLHRSVSGAHSSPTRVKAGTRGESAPCAAGHRQHMQTWEAAWTAGAL